MKRDYDPTLLAFATEVGTDGPISVEGCRTRWQVGGPVAPDSRLVRAPSGILEHRPEEMIVRVRAGTSVAQLHAEIETSGQRTALPERQGTVGGALAVGESDVAVLGRGRVRDCVLQLSYVSADGVLVTGGGPTVKNVSGFDLPRLLVGSLGTLGLMAELTLRTNPIPPVSRWLESSDADVFAVPNTVHRPSAVLWDGTRSWVQLEGHQADVCAEQRVLAGIGHWDEVAGPPELPACRWSLPAGELSGIDKKTLGSYVMCVGVGTVFAELPQPQAQLPAALAALTQRVKLQFDPSGRLNPGRQPIRRA